MAETENFTIEEAGTKEQLSYSKSISNSFFSHRLSESRVSEADGYRSLEGDFIKLISVVSWLYSRHAYLPFDIIDLNKHEGCYTSIASGSTFRVTTTTALHSLPSAYQSSKYEQEKIRVVVKRPQGAGDLFDAEGNSLDNLQLQSFLTELLILDHNDIYEHENIVNLKGVGWYYNQFTLKPTAQPRIILEEAHSTLSSFLVTHSDLTWNFRLKLCLDIACGLEVLHSCGIIHADLSSSNILIFEHIEDGRDAETITYRAKIADFGHAFAEGTRDKPPFGTVGYMAPEIVERLPVSDMKAIDIYSLGVILWKCLVTKFAADFSAPRRPLVEHEGSDADIVHLLDMIQIQHEEHADEARTHAVQELFRNSIRFSPNNRNLSQVIAGLTELIRRTQTMASGRTMQNASKENQRPLCSTPVKFLNDLTKHVCVDVSLHYFKRDK
jgi:serine/threonine protein kinase